MRSCATRGLLGLLLVLTACSGGNNGTGGGAGGGSGGSGGSGGGGVLDKNHSTGGSSWTVLVYMVADNDLEPFALDDLKEMMTVGSGTGLNIVVQVDRADGYSTDGVGGLPDFTSTKRVLVQQGSLQELADLGELNMADPATLADFVTWGLKTYPADRTAVVFWDHGGGWGGFGVDEASGGNLLHLAQIEQGLAQGRTGANAKPLAMVGFDACLMATWEVALTMAPHAEYLLASEETEPGHGWDWTALSVLKTSPSSDPVALGKQIIKSFLGQATTEKTVDSVTLSLIDLYRLGTLGSAIDAVTKTFDNTAPLATAFARGQEGAQKYGDSPDPGKALNLVDIGHLVTLTAKEAPSVAAVQAQLNSALGQAVIDHAEGAGRANSKGMAIYFPPDSRYYTAAYDDLAAPTSWRAFLKSYFGISNASTSQPTFTNANKLAVTSFPAAGGFLTEGTLASDTATSVARATLQYGLVNGTDLVVLGEVPATVNTTAVQGEWDLSVLTLTQGTNTGFGFASVSAAGANKIELNILFAYQKSASVQAQSCVRQLVFTSDAQGNVTLASDAYYVDTAGAFGELNPAVGSTLTPVVKTISTTNGAEALAAGTGTPFTPTTGANGLQEFQLTLEYRKVLPAQQVFGVLRVENAGGKGDAVVGVAVTP